MTGRKRSSVGQVVAGLVVGAAVCMAGTLAAADKYALLVAVAVYEHPEMNTPRLVYPEADARDLKKLLEDSGYQVDLLVGKAATQQAIVDKLRAFGQRGGDNGVIVAGLFGHGIEFARTKKSYFCPYDTPVQAVRDAQNRVLNNDDGSPRLEPVAARLVAMDDVLVALRESKAAHRVLLADCCRNDPNAARGRSFGSSLETNQLPKNTAVLFACSEGQKAFEHKDWGHGAFTMVLLDVLQRHAADGKTTMGTIAEDVGPGVEQLTATKLRDDDQPQSPRLLLTGTRVDLMLDRPAKLPRPKLLVAPFSQAESKAAQRAWATYLNAEPEVSNKFGMKLALIPPGAFTMGSPLGETDRDDNETPHSVQITKPYYLGIHEVTVGQFRKFVTSAGYKTKAEKDGIGGWGWNAATRDFESEKPEYTWRNPGFAQTDEHPVVNVSWNDAQAFCAWLSRETGATYRLPTEAEWEYACRAGTTTAYWYGDDDLALTKVGNILDATAKAKVPNYRRFFMYSSGRDGGVLTVPVGKFASNGFGLYEMHCNVFEWCQDVYGAYDLQQDADPVGPAPLKGSDRVLRGGAFNYDPWYCRSAVRFGISPGLRFIRLGFRLALVAELSSSNR